jgi:phosphosulfolactate synthase
MTTEVREKTIQMAAELGFKVLTEVGKKEGEQTPLVHDLVDLALKDLECGAYKVILEGRESGTGVGLYDESGNIVEDDLKELMEGIGDPKVIIWETPQKKQQQDMILRFGSNVNLGNIPPREVIALEALRVGLRADTLKFVCDNNSTKMP